MRIYSSKIDIFLQVLFLFLLVFFFSYNNLSIQFINFKIYLIDSSINEYIGSFVTI